MGILYGGERETYMQHLACDLHRLSAVTSFLVFNLLCAPCFAAIGAIKREMNNAEVDLVRNRLSVPLRLCGLAYD